ncbi:hypothetical protein DFH06DRAFT_1209653 [Mycena polygramma]|nr:hypothetical protein DFH06DRAFT_1209653 [Mycena polygramma]
MHDCLQLRNISKIRGSLRPIAEGAAAGSVKDLRILRSRVVGGLPKTLAVLVLPAIFANLDPAGLPEPEELDDILTSSSTLMPRIHCAIIALRLVLDVILDVLPPNASPDIWSFVWPWIEFFHTYWHSLPSIIKEDGIPAGLVHLIHAGIIASLAVHTPTRDTIRSTAGVRRILVMSWKDLIEDLWGHFESGSFENASRLLHLFQPRPGHRIDFEEIVEAAGGAVADVASVLVKHVRRAAAQEPPNSNVGDFLSAAIMTFAGEHGPPLIGSAVQAFRLVSVLVATILALHGLCPRTPVDMCIVCMVEALKCPPGYPYVVQALDAGLLRCIILVGDSPSNHAIHPETKSSSALIAELLTEILPSSLVYYRVLLQLKVSFPDAEKLSSTLDPNSSFSKQWRTFSSLVTARLQSLSSWEEASNPSFKACDNALCGKIDERRGFKTCSTCENADYCSKQCQAADWRDGHKDVCNELRLFHLRECPEAISTRGRCFMRALLTRDYSLHLAEICMKEVLFMYLNPDTAFMTIFAYSGNNGGGGTGGTRVEIQPKSFSEEATGWDPNLPAQFARAKKSGGRMQIHVMFLLEGERRSVRVFPMHTNTSALYDGLRRVAQSLRQGMSPDEAWQWALEKARIVVEEATKGMIYMH